jgi:hypothetical protein
MFTGNSYFYYFIIGLQVFCLVHCIRRNNTNPWVWVILFLPLIGSLVYLFTEVFGENNVRGMQQGLGKMLYPIGSIKKLETNLAFSDNFANRVALADACLHAGQTDRAIALYESSLTGAFTENEHVLAQLIMAYGIKKEYEKLVTTAKKIYNVPQFARSSAHIQYAIALEHVGRKDLAEQEFKKMKSRFSNFEARYQYGLFLERNDRHDEASALFEEILSGKSYLGARERRYNREWLNKAAEAKKKMNNLQKT